VLRELVLAYSSHGHCIHFLKPQRCLPIELLVVELHVDRR